MTPVNASRTAYKATGIAPESYLTHLCASASVRQRTNREPSDGQVWASRANSRKRLFVNLNGRNCPPAIHRVTRNA